MGTRQDTTARGDTDVVDCEWRTHVMYGYTRAAKGEFDPIRDLAPLVVEKLRADPSLLEYQWHDNRDDGQHWCSAGDPDRHWGEHWLTAEQVARLPSELGNTVFADVSYKEPLDFIAGDPEGGNFFESAIRAGALPLFEGIELGLHALEVFILDVAKEPRPDILMASTQDPSR